MSQFEDFNYFGGAVLADEYCGSVSFSTAGGEVLTINVHDDPELTMSGLVEPDSRPEKW